jgi:Family of unknown function (DUF6159)
MFEKLSRSWGLVKASGAVLMESPQLMLFPFVSAIAAFIVLACFALPMFGLSAMDGLSGGNTVWGIGHFVVAFFFYLTQYFVIFFFNVALVGAAMIRLNGGSPTLGDGLKIAASKWVSILGYAAIAATVGMLLRAIQERVPFVGKIIVGLLGAGWTLATFMVVPVLVSRDVNAIDAVKESVSLLHKTWGENVIGQAGMSMVFTLVQVGIIILSIGLVIGAIASGSTALIVIAVLLGIAGVLIAALVSAALSGIYAAALYRFAVGGEATEGFDNTALQSAFSAK